MDRKLEVVVINTDKDIEDYRIDTMRGAIKCDYCKRRWSCVESMMRDAEKCKTCNDYRNKKSAPRKKRSK
jgi:hypothetical protein